MGSNRSGEANCKVYAEDPKVLVNRKANSPSTNFEINENDTFSKSRQSSPTPEYVKRTVKLFESVTLTEGNNSLDKKSSIEHIESCNREEKRTPEKDYMKISLDSLDGEINKKPSYLGVSCSNSGYRNVINYDSKLREGFWTANSQRGSLVLSNSRLRESSPMRRDFDFTSHNGNSFRKSPNLCAEKEKKVPLNDSSQMQKFVNISTSTKTISTFRNSKDIKANDLENNVNGFKNHHSTNSEEEPKVNLKQILNGKPETNRRGYSNLGFSPKILKSPEKNCNSFLKNISSFENNCKKSQTVKNSSYSKTEQTNLTNSIQQRIERLYGPAALAHGFYSQKSNFKQNKTHSSENIFSAGSGKSISQSTALQNGSSKSIDLNSVINNSFQSTPEPKIIALEHTNGHGVIENVKMESNECEKNGVYFLQLLKKETDRLERLASFAEKELENGENLSEEISGKLRVAAGKARLLMSQKLNQFEGLCQKNMNEKPSDSFPTTSEDLAGFWDMVMLQVVQVYKVFEELEELKKNHWKGYSAKKEAGISTSNGEIKPVKISPVKKISPQNGSVSEKRSQKSEAAKKAREEGRRKLLEERRKKMKEQKQNKITSNESEIEIFAK